MEDGSMITYAVEYPYGDALRTSVMRNLYGWYSQVDSLIIILIILYHISYGRISPVTTISEFTQIVYPNGILNNGSYGVDNSYGTLRTSIMYIHGSLV